jgi:SAM-dependent methyltransferase
MQDAVYHQYALTLETHWWADHRRKLVERYLSELGVARDGSRSVLEIGCGAGTEHAFLSGYGPVTGIEISESGLGYCRKRGYAQLIGGDLNEVAIPAASADIAVDFHVLYHAWVRDPAAVLARMRDALKPGGHLVLTEPAYQALRRSHDDVVMAARRWNRSELIKLVTAAGFEVERCTGFLTLLIPAVLLSKLRDRLMPQQHDIGELHPPNPIIDGIVRGIMAVERAVIRLQALPTGTCWAIVARRA